jgi:hypothetical protein
MAWTDILRWLAIALAVGGGLASLAAFWIGRRADTESPNARRAHVTYLVSYILMSLSVFFLALGGLLAE